MATLLLIRPEAQSRRLIEALAERGLRPRTVISPVMEIRPRGVKLPEGADLVLTSQNAVAALPEGRWRVWCVGDRTAMAARLAGLDAISAAGDVEALLSLLRAERPGPVVHVRGAHATGALVARLRAVGIPAEEVIAYDQIAQPLTAAAAGVLARKGKVVLPLYSPRSAAIVSGHLGSWNAEVLTVAISRSAAAAFRRPSRMTVVEMPTGEAMERGIAAVFALAEGSRLVDRDGAG